MARDVAEVRIDELNYKIYQLPPLKAQSTFIKLIKIFGPSMSKILPMIKSFIKSSNPLEGIAEGGPESDYPELEEGEKPKEDKVEKNDIGSLLDTSMSDILENVEWDLIGDALTELTERLDEDQVQKLTLDLLDYVEVQTSGEKWVKVRNRLQSDYTGKAAHLMKVIFHAVWVNYGDFLAEVIKRRKGKVGEAQNSRGKKT